MQISRAKEISNYADNLNMTIAWYVHTLNTQTVNILCLNNYALHVYTINSICKWPHRQ